MPGCMALFVGLLGTLSGIDKYLQVLTSHLEMGKEELVPSLCGDSLNQQPVGDGGGSTGSTGSTGSLSSSWGTGTTPAEAWGRSTEYRTEEIRGWGLLTESHLPPYLAEFFHRAADSAL